MEKILFILVLISVSMSSSLVLAETCSFSEDLEQSYLFKGGEGGLELSFCDDKVAPSRVFLRLVYTDPNQEFVIDRATPVSTARYGVALTSDPGPSLYALVRGDISRQKSKEIFAKKVDKQSVEKLYFSKYPDLSVVTVMSADREWIKVFVKVNKTKIVNLGTFQNLR